MPEAAESDVAGAARELQEESALTVGADELLPVLTFFCNCDPTEPEHAVSVFAVSVPVEQLRLAVGDKAEPVIVVRELPQNLLWYIEPLLMLVRVRMRQPR